MRYCTGASTMSVTRQSLIATKAEAAMALSHPYA